MIGGAARRGAKEKSDTGTFPCSPNKVDENMKNNRTARAKTKERQEKRPEKKANRVYPSAGAAPNLSSEVHWSMIR